jgi:hypothetical protein
MRTPAPTKPDKRWRDGYFVRAFQLSSNGYKKRQIAEALGVPWSTFCRWLRDRPALARAIADGRGKAPAGVSHSKTGLAQTGQTFADYVYRQLPTDLAVLYQRVMKVTCPEDENVPADAQDRVDDLFDRCEIKHARMTLFFHAFIASNFNRNEACRRIGISRTAVDKWYREEPKFKELIDAVPGYMADFAEAGLFRNIAGGDTTSIIFALKCLKPKVYNPPKVVQLDGRVDHTHKHRVSKAVLDRMPVEQKRALLDALHTARDMKEVPQPPEATDA